MATQTNNDTYRPRQRFGDAVEYARGKRDGEAGRAPASFAIRYVDGYNEGRRARRREVNRPRT